MAGSHCRQFFLALTVWFTICRSNECRILQDLGDYISTLEPELLFSVGPRYVTRPAGSRHVSQALPVKYIHEPLNSKINDQPSRSSLSQNSTTATTFSLLDRLDDLSASAAAQLQLLFKHTSNATASSRQPSLIPPLAHHRALRQAPAFDPMSLRSSGPGTSTPTIPLTGQAVNGASGTLDDSLVTGTGLDTGLASASSAEGVSGSSGGVSGSAEEVSDSPLAPQTPVRKKPSKKHVSTAGLIVIILCATQGGAFLGLILLQWFRCCHHNKPLTYIIDILTGLLTLALLPTFVAVLAIVAVVWLAVLVLYWAVYFLTWPCCGLPRAIRRLRYGDPEDRRPREHPADAAQGPGVLRQQPSDDLSRFYFTVGDPNEPRLGVPQATIDTFPVHKHTRPQTPAEGAAAGADEQADRPYIVSAGLQAFAAMRGLLWKGREEVAGGGDLQLAEVVGDVEEGGKRGKGAAGGAPQEDVEAEQDKGPQVSRAMRQVVMAISGRGEERSGATTRPCCTICLEEYEEGEELRTLPCIHAFHKGCIDSWMASHATCPICRTELLPPSSSAQDPEPADGGS